jgi:hypothetical protein
MPNTYYLYFIMLYEHYKIWLDQPCYLALMFGEIVPVINSKTAQMGGFLYV